MYYPHTVIGHLWRKELYITHITQLYARIKRPERSDDRKSFSTMYYPYTIIGLLWWKELHITHTTQLYARKRDLKEATTRNPHHSDPFWLSFAILCSGSWLYKSWHYPHDTASPGPIRGGGIPVPGKKKKPNKKLSQQYIEQSCLWPCKLSKYPHDDSFLGPILGGGILVTKKKN